MPVLFVVVLDDEKWRGRVGEPKIVVVDYHKGNLSSVVRGLARAGAAACTSDDPEQIRNADGLVIPGVGAFYDAIAFMRQSGEEVAVLDAVAAGQRLLTVITRNKGGANKDLSKFADQINSLCDKWDR